MTNDLLNKRFERLLVIRKNEIWRRYWICLCDCGEVSNVRGSHLISGATRSCGCMRNESSKARALAGVPNKNRAGHTKLPEYTVWHGMKGRCLNPKDDVFHHYGGRGITVCERWRGSFQNFIADMGRRPIGTSLDRINNDGNYEPGNCRWTDKSTQMNNRRGNAIIVFKGESRTLTQWAARLGLPYKTVSGRYLAGMPIEKIFSPIQLHNHSGLALGGRASGDAKLKRLTCKRGHEYTEANTKWYHGGRVCRACHAWREKNRREARHS